MTIEICLASYKTTNLCFTLPLAGLLSERFPLITEHRIPTMHEVFKRFVEKVSKNIRQKIASGKSMIRWKHGK